MSGKVIAPMLSMPWELSTTVSGFLSVFSVVVVSGGTLWLAIYKMVLEKRQRASTNSQQVKTTAVTQRDTFIDQLQEREAKSEERLQRMEDRLETLGRDLDAVKLELDFEREYSRMLLDYGYRYAREGSPPPPRRKHVP